jgi:hypothetical protein
VSFISVCVIDFLVGLWVSDLVAVAQCVVCHVVCWCCPCMAGFAQWELQVDFGRIFYVITELSQ